MKSGRQRRTEIVAKRKVRHQKHARVATSVDVVKIPTGAVIANQELLAHDNTWGHKPMYYIDVRFDCVDCGTQEIWKATQQKWWYEVAKGKVASRANRCSACRRRLRERRAKERGRHIEGLILKYGLEAAAKKLSLTPEEVARLRSRGLPKSRSCRRPARMMRNAETRRRT